MNNSKSLIALALIIFLTFSCSSILLAQTQSEATLLPAFNQSSNSTFIGSNGDHWWKFDLLAGEGITAALTSHFNAGYVRLYLYDANGTQLNYTNYIYDGKTDLLQHQVAANGTYFLRITGTALGNYDLAVYPAWFNTDVVDGDRNFYHGFSAARYLANGSYTRATMPDGTPIGDSYRFTMGAGETISVSLTGHFNAGYVHLYLYDAYGKELARVYSIANGETDVLAKTVNTDGVFYLEVTGSASGFYDLQISGAEVDNDSDNDGLNDAVEYYHAINPYTENTDGDGNSDYTELLSGGKPHAFNAYLDTQVAKLQGDALQIPYFNRVFNGEYKRDNGDHWWKFDVASEEGVTVALTTHLNAGYTHLYLYDANGVQLNYTRYLYNGETQLLSHKMALNGTYYLKITGSTATVGNYDLAVYPAWFNSGVLDVNRDFYHDFYTARYLSDGTYSRTAMPNGTPLNDLYRFSAQTGDSFEVGVTGHFNYGYVRLYLYYEDGTELQNVGYLYDGQTLTLKEAINLDGNYYLMVTGTALGSYDLFTTHDEDNDHDGIHNSIDNCPNHRNTKQLDFDNDLMGDDCDPDDDNDGMPDIWENANNLNPKNAADAAIDSDNDSYSNLEEFQANSNPNDDKSYPGSANSKDFNADGSPDLLLRNYNHGKNQIWYLDGAYKIGQDNLPTIPDTNWTFEGMADFNSDGKPDLLLRNHNHGKNQIWYMNGATKIGQASLPTIPDINWVFEGAADFNGDGKPDIVLRNHKHGKNLVWYMDGATKIGQASLPTIPDTNWIFEGVADFNGDSKQDLILRNHNHGKNLIWFMNGVNRIGQASLPTIPDTFWVFQGATDYNNDYKPDLLLRNYLHGANMIWYMNGASKTGQDALPRIPDTNWRIENR